MAEGTDQANKRRKTETDEPAAQGSVTDQHDGPEKQTVTNAPLSYSDFPVQELMKQYYSRLFPHQHMYKWLAYGSDSKHPQADTNFFHRREFCFTLDGDIFVRYQSFKNGDDLRAAIINKLPAKIDIGPVYNVDPKHRNAYSGSDGSRKFMPVERELVFDVDLTDYDDVRSCGSGGHICNRCWPLMAVAIKILDMGLRQDFGFKHVLWVFSGRRGVHAWICDARARKLSDEARASIAAFLSVHKGQEKGVSRLTSSSARQDHPYVDAAVELLEQAWVQSILPEQQHFEHPNLWTAILAHIPDEGKPLRDKLQQHWTTPGKEQAQIDSSGDVNVARWNQLCAELDKLGKEKNAKNQSMQGQCQKAKKDIILACAYPRLDVEVSKKMNHLLKAPFCVHPKTGKVCVPIDPELADSFDPVDGVPTVSQLLGELADPAHAAIDAQERWRQTSLNKAVNDFNTCFLDSLIADNKSQLTMKARQAVAQPTAVW